MLVASPVRQSGKAEEAPAAAGVGSMEGAAASDAALMPDAGGGVTRGVTAGLSAMRRTMHCGSPPSRLAWHARCGSLHDHHGHALAQARRASPHAAPGGALFRSDGF